MLQGRFFPSLSQPFLAHRGQRNLGARQCVVLLGLQAKGATQFQPLEGNLDEFPDQLFRLFVQLFEIPVVRRHPALFN